MRHLVLIVLLALELPVSVDSTAPVESGAQARSDPFLMSVAERHHGLESAQARIWTVLAADAEGDGRDSSQADAAQLSYRYDPAKDELWFRVTLYGTPNQKEFEVNIAFDTGADESARMNW